MDIATKSHFDACQFHKWYPLFKDISIPSKIFKVNTLFLKYLLSDSIFLPESGFAIKTNINDDYDDDDNDDDNNDDNNDDDDVEDNHISLDIKNYLDNELIPFIRTTIMNSNSKSVFVKLNWSSPKDAAWINTSNTYKCVEPNDVLLLLKSSNFITHELINPYEGCELESDRSGTPNDYYLILRNWLESITPNMEFRCFVKDGHLIAISQRDISNKYKFLEPIKYQISEIINLFFDSKLRGNFSERNYVFDIYIKNDLKLNESENEIIEDFSNSNLNDIDLINKVILIDINPFSRTTDSLLYTWEEICQLSIPIISDDLSLSLPQIRISKIQSQHTEYSFNRVPRDFVDLSNGEAISKFVDQVRSGDFDEYIKLNGNHSDDDDNASLSR